VRDPLGSPLALGVQPLEHGRAPGQCVVIEPVAVLGADRFDYGEVSDTLEFIAAQLDPRVQCGGQHLQPQCERLARTRLSTVEPVARVQFGVDDVHARVGGEREGLEDVDQAVAEQRPGRLTHLGGRFVANPQGQASRVAGCRFWPDLVQRQPQARGEPAAPCAHVAGLHAVRQIDNRQVTRAVPMDLDRERDGVRVLGHRGIDGAELHAEQGAADQLGGQLAVCLGVGDPIGDRLVPRPPGPCQQHYRDSGGEPDQRLGHDGRADRDEDHGGQDRYGEQCPAPPGLTLALHVSSRSQVVGSSRLAAPWRSA
jgi:hypothetical protein